MLLSQNTPGSPSTLEPLNLAGCIGVERLSSRATQFEHPVPLRSGQHERTRQFDLIGRLNVVPLRHAADVSSTRGQRNREFVKRDLSCTTQPGELGGRCEAINAQIRDSERSERLRGPLPYSLAIRVKHELETDASPVPAPGCQRRSKVDPVQVDRVVEGEAVGQRDDADPFPARAGIEVERLVNGVALTQHEAPLKEAHLGSPDGQQSTDPYRAPVGTVDRTTLPKQFKRAAGRLKSIDDLGERGANHRISKVFAGERTYPPQQLVAQRSPTCSMFLDCLEESRVIAHGGRLFHDRQSEGGEQMVRQRRTSAAAARAASKVLRSRNTSRTSKRAAGSALSQATPKRRK
jgi:hypothetical protein